MCVMKETKERSQKQSPEHRIAAVWRGRADRLGQRPTLAEENLWPVIVLGIGKERYGVDLSDVAEVLALLPVTPVPGAPPIFSGVINVHGEIRPVVDLRRLLGMQTVSNAHVARVILLRKEGREMGLQIDSVEEVRRIGPGELQLAGSSDLAHSAHIKGSTKDLLMLLSTEALFAELHRGVTA
jgi:purine-binding chemotaxis protein CheW